MGPQNNYVVKIGWVVKEKQWILKSWKLWLNDDESDDDKYDDDGDADDNDSDDDNKDCKTFHLKKMLQFIN